MFELNKDEKQRGERENGKQSCLD